MNLEDLTHKREAGMPPKWRWTIQPGFQGSCPDDFSILKPRFLMLTCSLTGCLRVKIHQHMIEYCTCQNHKGNGASERVFMKLKDRERTRKCFARSLWVIHPSCSINLGLFASFGTSETVLLKSVLTMWMCNRHCGKKRERCGAMPPSFWSAGRRSKHFWVPHLQDIRNSRKCLGDKTRVVSAFSRGHGGGCFNSRFWWVLYDLIKAWSMVSWCFKNWCVIQVGSKLDTPAC